MHRNLYEQYTAGWTEVRANLRLQVHLVIKWLFEYDSDKRFFIAFGDSSEKAEIRLKFESQEDAMMFMMIWLGIDM